MDSENNNNNNNNTLIENPEALIDFFNGLTQKHTEFAQHIDNQASILIGLNTAIFAFIASGLAKMGGVTPLYFVVLIFFSVLSGVLALLAVHPPSFMRKRGQRESFLLYNKKISSFQSDEYLIELKKILIDTDKLINEFGLEVYNIAKYYYRPKRTLFTYSRNVFLAGLIMSFILFLLH